MMTKRELNELETQVKAEGEAVDAEIRRLQKAAAGVTGHAEDCLCPVCTRLNEQLTKASALQDRYEESLKRYAAHVRERQALTEQLKKAARIQEATRGCSLFASPSPLKARDSVDGLRRIVSGRLLS